MSVQTACQKLVDEFRSRPAFWLGSLIKTMETAEGALPPPSRAFLQRFGGLGQPGKVSNG